MILAFNNIYAIAIALILSIIIMLILMRVCMFLVLLLVTILVMLLVHVGIDYVMDTDSEVKYVAELLLLMVLLFRYILLQLIDTQMRCVYQQGSHVGYVVSNNVIQQCWSSG